MRSRPRGVRACCEAFPLEVSGVSALGAQDRREFSNARFE